MTDILLTAAVLWEALASESDAPSVQQLRRAFSLPSSASPRLKAPARERDGAERPAGASVHWSPFLDIFIARLTIQLGCQGGALSVTELAGQGAATGKMSPSSSSLASLGLGAHVPVERCSEHERVVIFKVKNVRNGKILLQFLCDFCI